ncbi:MAG: hypothetical protein ACI9DK_000095 [Vicingaceae bacterium]|jgi:hypothetical protein
MNNQFLKQLRQLYKWGLSTFGIALIYFLGFLVFGEIHPFSRFPMYSHFPNWSYSFYVTSEQDEIVPFSNFETNGGTMGHLYGSSADQLNISYGNFMESNKELEQIGASMMNSLLSHSPHKDKHYKLYRKAFFFKNDSIQNRIDLMVIYGSN